MLESNRSVFLVHPGMGNRERVYGSGHSFNVTPVCCVSSVRYNKATVAPGEQKANCDTRPGGRIFSQELLSAARRLLSSVCGHRGIHHRCEWLQDNLSNGVCGEPWKQSSTTLFTAQTRLITFSVLTFLSFYVVDLTEADFLLFSWLRSLHFPPRGQPQNRRPKPDTNTSAQETWAAKSFGKSHATSQCQRCK